MIRCQSTEQECRMRNILLKKFDSRVYKQNRKSKAH